jgi:Protein of unknown function (DUF2568)
MRAATCSKAPTRTKPYHLSNVFSKLQVADRAQAIIRAREAGLGEVHTSSVSDIGSPSDCRVMALLRSRKFDSVLTLLKNANLALAFLLELCALVALGYWGLQSGQGMIAKIGLAIGAPVVAVVIWALFGAPKAVWPLVGPWHLIVDVVFFGGAAVALFAAGQRQLAVAFALVVVINHILAYVWGQ